MGNDKAEIKVPWTLGKTEEDGAFRRIGTKDLVKNGLQEEDAKVSSTPTAASSSTPGSHCSE